MKTVREVIHGVFIKALPHGGYVEPEDTGPLTDSILSALKEAGLAVVPVDVAQAGIKALESAQVLTASQDQGRG